MERLGWLRNFDRVAAGESLHDRAGWQFSDSEVYKLLEAFAWEFGATGSASADARFREIAHRVARAQDPDGYLNTCYGHGGRPPRYSDMEMGHELYCIGHLLQAAVARVRTVGSDDVLVDVARKAADHVCREFGERDAICGHPEIESALVEFGRALAEPRYPEQARVFVERRGRGLLTPRPLLGAQYFQDDIPVRETEAWHGHAVRALYLAAGAADVATESLDVELLTAVRRQWDRTVERRTFLTGGMGSRHQDEGFGDDWELPPDRAYCETCAGVASNMVSWRLLLATGEVRYADLMERTLFNVLATAMGPGGRSFFYANPLQQRVPADDIAADAENPRAEGGVRAPWFDVSCCPTNLARTFASLHTYVLVSEGDTVSIAQYASGEFEAELDGGRLVLSIETDYPVSGEIVIEVTDAPPHRVSLQLRVPPWAGGATVEVTGQPALRAKPGWCPVMRTFEAGDRIRLRLPVEPRLTFPDPRIDALRGTVAVERGPVVLCLESPDLPVGVDIDTVRIDIADEPRDSPPGASVHGVLLDAPTGERGVLPFGGSRPFAVGGELEFRLVPYHAWARRGPSTMRVFIPYTEPKGKQDGIV